MADIIHYTPQNWMDDFLSSRWPSWMSDLNKNTGIQADMWEQNNTVYLKMALPDMDPSDIDIQVKDGVLKIKGIKKIERERNSNRRYFYQSMQSSIEHNFSLPYDVNTEKSVAKMEKGVLHLTLPKSEEINKHTIQVE